MKLRNLGLSFWTLIVNFSKRTYTLNTMRNVYSNSKNQSLVCNQNPSFKRALLSLSAIIAVSLSGAAQWAHASEIKKPAALSAKTQAAHSDIKREKAGEIASVQGVVFVRGDGRSSAGPLKPAKAGDAIYENDVINTSSSGSVKLLLRDKTIIDVGASALFKMDKFKANSGADREVEMNMMYGTIRGAVTQKLQGKGKFHLRTPTATMGVRGTEFVVQSEVKNLKEVSHGIKNPGTPPPVEKPKAGEPAAPASTAKTQITVLQGKVEVASKPSELGTAEKPSSGKGVALTAGQQISTTAETAKAKEAPKVVQLDTKQLSSLSTATKIQDNTFKNAVVLDLGSNTGGSSGDGRSGTPGAGAETLAILSAVIVESPALSLPPVSMADLGISGTFGGSQNAFTPPAAVPTANAINSTTSGPKRVRIIISN